MDHLLKHTRLDPPLALLINHFPAWQVTRHEPPRGSRTDDPTQAIEHFAQVVYALWRFFGHQGQIGCHKRPLFITDITRVSFSVHARSLAYSIPSSSQTLGKLPMILKTQISLARSP